IEFLGKSIDPSVVISERTEIPLEVPGIAGGAKLTVIEWNLQNVDRKLYLCAPGGAIIDELQPGIHAVGAEFTAYLESDEFTDKRELLLEGDIATPAGKVVEAGRKALRSHLADSMRRSEGATISQWQDEGVYPYKNEPASAVEQATRDTFNMVAMAASRTVNESKSRSSKA